MIFIPLLKIYRAKLSQYLVSGFHAKLLQIIRSNLLVPQDQYCHYDWKQLRISALRPWRGQTKSLHFLELGSGKKWNTQGPIVVTETHSLYQHSAMLNMYFCLGSSLVSKLNYLVCWRAFSCKFWWASNFCMQGRGGQCCLSYHNPLC